MKYKYIEEKYPVYFVWGKGVDGQVDIATALDDTVATVSQEHAEKLIQDRDDLVRRLCDMAQAFDRSSPEEFKKFWYGPCLAQAEPVTLTRPECLDFAMDFLGGPEETEVRRYVEALEARPTIEPVPVSERPWERERWLDAEGRCWMGHPGDAEFIPSWRLCRPEDAPSMTRTLPYWALPLPC